MKRKKQTTERDLKEREKTLDDLKKQVEAFPSKLEKELSHARAQVAKEIKGECHFQVEFAKKEQEGAAQTRNYERPLPHKNDQSRE